MDKKLTVEQLNFMVSMMLAEIKDAGHYSDCYSLYRDYPGDEYRPELCDCPYKFVIKNEQSKNPFFVPEL